MTTLATFLLAHLIGDFPLQTNRIFKLKNEGNLGIALHVAIHVIITAIFIQNPLQHWHVLAILGIVHFATDWAKLRIPMRRQAPGFVLDQAAHVLTIVALVTLFPNIPTSLPDWALYPALLLAIIPAMMTFGWVWANDISCQSVQTNSGRVQWARRSLLPMSQRMGRIIFIMVLSCMVII